MTQGKLDSKLKEEGSYMTDTDRRNRMGFSLLVIFLTVGINILVTMFLVANFPVDFYCAEVEGNLAQCKKDFKTIQGGYLEGLDQLDELVVDLNNLDQKLKDCRKDQYYCLEMLDTCDMFLVECESDLIECE